MGEPAPLSGMRIIDVSMLDPGALTTHLADLGAEVIKVEPPEGDYVRRMVWPIIDGVSLLHLHIARGKRSVVLDLRQPAGVAVFLDLVARADAVVEAMRPGALERRGLGLDRLRQANPRIVLCSLSGYGATGPYRDLPSHGIAYDAWAGLIRPEFDDDGFAYLPEHTSVGIHAGPLYGALTLLAAVTAARSTGVGSHVDVAQSDAAAALDWMRIETHRAYQRPADVVTGNPSDNYERRPPGTGGMRDAGRYQVYKSSDGFVLFMASERRFWRNFCAGVGRPDLFERYPGAQYADHARGNTHLRAELRSVFRSRTTREWVALGIEVDTPLCPVNTPETITSDPQFRDRMPWLRVDELGADELPFPARIDGVVPRRPEPAPRPGEHAGQVLREVLGYDAQRVAALHGQGVLD